MSIENVADIKKTEKKVPQSRCGGYTHYGSRDRKISEFKARLLYMESSREVKTIQIGNFLVSRKQKIKIKEGVRLHEICFVI